MKEKDSYLEALMENMTKLDERTKITREEFLGLIPKFDKEHVSQDTIEDILDNFEERNPRKSDVESENFDKIEKLTICIGCYDIYDSEEKDNSICYVSSGNVKSGPYCMHCAYSEI